MSEEAGYKVTLKQVHAEVLNIKDEMLPKIWDSQNDICRKLDKYNGLHGKVEELAIETLANKKYLRELRDEVKDTRTREETEADVLKRISDAKEKTRKSEHDKFMRILKVVGIILAIVGLFAAYIR